MVRNWAKSKRAAKSFNCTDYGEDRSLKLKIQNKGDDEEAEMVKVLSTQS